MDNDQIVGAIVMIVCGFGCGALFSAIGRFAKRSKKPFGFWAGKSVPMDKVTDLCGYNHANALMWETYAMPYWLSGVLGLFGIFCEGFTLASAIVMSAAAFPGVFCLIYYYTRIEKKYIVK